MQIYLGVSLAATMYCYFSTFIISFLSIWVTWYLPFPVSALYGNRQTWPHSSVSVLVCLRWERRQKCLGAAWYSWPRFVCLLWTPAFKWFLSQYLRCSVYLFMSLIDGLYYFVSVCSLLFGCLDFIHSLCLAVQPERWFNFMYFSFLPFSWVVFLFIITYADYCFCLYSFDGCYLEWQHFK